MKLTNPAKFFCIFVEQQELGRRLETAETHEKNKQTNKVKSNTWVHPNTLNLKKRASNTHGGITEGMTPPHDLDLKKAKEANPRW